jgi:purine catabolism regulator
VVLLPDRTAPPGPASTAAHRADDPFEVVRGRTGQVAFTVGISEREQRPERAPALLEQARHAADLGVRLGRAGRTTSYEELGIYRLLLHIDDLDQLLDYARDVLGPLMDYDTRGKPDLVHTLSTYLSQHESPKQTARVLRVHVNTVSYRIQRIQALTSLDLTDPDDRLSAHVAVKILESLRAGGTVAGRHGAASSPHPR